VLTYHLLVNPFMRYTSLSKMSSSTKKSFNVGDALMVKLIMAFIIVAWTTTKNILLMKLIVKCFYSIFGLIAFLNFNPLIFNKNSNSSYYIYLIIYSATHFSRSITPINKSIISLSISAYNHYQIINND